MKIVSLIMALGTFFVCVQCMRWVYRSILAVGEVKGIRSLVHIILYIALWTYVYYIILTNPKSLSLGMFIMVLVCIFAINLINYFLGVRITCSLTKVVFRMYLFLIMGMTVAMTYYNTLKFFH